MKDETAALVPQVLGLVTKEYRAWERRGCPKPAPHVTISWLLWRITGLRGQPQARRRTVVQNAVGVLIRRGALYRYRDPDQAVGGVMPTPK